MESKQYSVEIEGKTITAEFSDLADQADGAVIMRCGDTTVLVTAVMGKHESPAPFFPLTVEYEERFYAAGKILGSQFVRREGRPTEEAVLSGRIVDRTIRPLFDQRIRHDVQVVITVLALGDYDPDFLSVIGASLALGTSNIPWNGPASAIRLQEKEGGFIANPTYTDRGEDDYSLLVCGKNGLVNMIELGANEMSEATAIAGLEKSVELLNQIEKWQQKIITEIGKEKRVLELPEVPVEYETLFAEKIGDETAIEMMYGSGPGKAGITALSKKWKDIFTEAIPEGNWTLAERMFEDKVDHYLHTQILEKDRRPDGRGLNEVRPLFAKAGGVSPVLHGSGIFYRGGTHVLSVLTLGGPDDALTMDGMEVSGSRRFLHHYNFPPFSVGETGRMGGLNRRMIGHGALAEKALRPMIPNKETFPYTIRIVSEALASNGSTSMASVCGSTLALMDAGVPIKKPIAGIASGLVMDGKGNYKLLTDIQGPEDFHGDMDFKVAGTTDGITAIQMDVKVLGIPVEVLAGALEKAKAARLQILDVMTKEISAPREKISPFAPEIKVIRIKPEQIGLIIGSGGKTINGIRDLTKTDISIDDDGTVFITGKNGGADKALQIIADMTKEFAIGEKVIGTVVKVLEFGAFVALNDSTEGLVHVSEFASFRVNDPQTLVKPGMKVPVVVKEKDERGRLKLSIKQADPHFFDSQKPASPAPQQK
jgi:polyribonucleotide nucleotidyltransferase